MQAHKMILLLQDVILNSLFKKSDQSLMSYRHMTDVLPINTFKLLGNQSYNLGRVMH